MLDGRARRTRCAIPRRAIARVAAAAALLSATSRGATARPLSTRVFSYPAAWRRPDDGAIMLSPIAVDAGSCTTGLPAIRELAGVVVMPLWSALNPAPGRFDFELIERALSYWSALGRSIVVGAVTFGYPVMTSRARMQHPVPDWVLERARSFKQTVPVIGPVKPLSITQRDVVFPLYWDPFFQQAQLTLIEALGRFDGHPALSTVRICTGITGEDNPTFDGLRDAMPGFGNARWMGYTRAVLNRYRATFRRTTLEFDIDRLGFIESLGTDVERVLADRLVRNIAKDQIFLAMNGLDPANVKAWLDGAMTGPAYSLRAVQHVQRAGGRVGVEGGGLDQLNMADVDTLVTACRLICPDRLVVFPDAIVALDRRRHGTSPASALAEAVFGDARMTSLADKGARLMEGIGA